MSTWLLIDGNSLTYRAFFALPTDIATASGQVTNAVYGFTSMLVNLVRDHRPDGVVVAFDRPEPTFRHAAFPAYKAQREAAPDILREQLGLVRELVAAFGFPVAEVAGFEADDVLATLATQLRDRGDEALVVTGDRDAYQLVEDPHVRVLYTQSRGVSELKAYDEAAVLERTGVPPGAYVDYAALRGDVSDNLPGVPGVGEKTAAKLVNAYGDVEGIVAHAGEQTPRLASSLTTHADVLRRNVDMMRLVRDAPVGDVLVPIDAGRVRPDEVRRLFGFFEFRSASLRQRLEDVLALLGAEPVTVATTDELTAPVLERPADAAAAAVRLGAVLSDSDEIAVAAAWSGTPGRSSMLGVAFVADPSQGAVWLSEQVAGADEVLDVLATLTSAGPDGRPVLAHGSKPLIRWLLDHGAPACTLRADTELAAYLLDPADARYALSDVLERYTAVRLPGHESQPSGQLALGGDRRDPAESAAVEAVAVSHLAPVLGAALDAQGLRALHDDIEVPLVRVLAKMESVGVGVDVAVLRALHDQLVSRCEQLTEEIWRDAGERFNVNSTPQLREILFTKLGLTPQKKTKTGYSTDAASLERLLGAHPIVEHLLRYRELEKLRSTYGEGLLAEVAADGRIHATFNQTVARTGRLSSDQPNLHNIPVRTEEGRAFRRAFVPAAGFDLLVADYNQIELRCIAHLSGDPGLIAAFAAGADIHAETAARVFGVSPDEVTAEQRSKAKMVSYGLAYGMEAYGLGQRLGIPTGDAQRILDAYFEAFPSVHDYMESTVAEARSRGYTETLFGRRRQIPELASPNQRIRQAGERQAMNAGIQGLAADIFKVALVRLDAALEQGGFASRIILQVHDELLVEVLPRERDKVARLVVDTMRSAFELRAPLEVHLGIGPSWADAKS